MNGHYSVASPRSNQLGVGLEFDAGPSLIHIDEIHMRIAGRRTVPEKVLESTGHAVGAMALDKSSGMAHDLGRFGGETTPDATDDQAVGVEVEIDDRCYIEIEAYIQQFCRGLRSNTARLLGFART